MTVMAVVGAGVVSAVGLSAEETAASARAGVMRFEESALLDRAFEPFVLATVPDPALPRLGVSLEDWGSSDRHRRLLRLAHRAVGSALEALPTKAGPPPLLLALPEVEGNDPLDGDALLDALSVQLGEGGDPEPPFDRSASDASRRGRAGGLGVLAAAAARLAAGARYVVAGGVDSYLDGDILAALDAEGRAKSPRNLDGFIPGEGAAFLVLADPAAARSAEVPALARVSAPVEGVEPGHLYADRPYRGEGLAAVVADALAGTNGDGPVREVFSSMNGESHWAKEWGVAFLRSRAGFAEDHGLHHPAEFYGDVGAAAGPAMVALAALGCRDGYRRSPALVYASSDRGERAAVLVHTP